MGTVTTLSADPRCWNEYTDPAAGLQRGASRRCERFSPSFGTFDDSEMLRVASASSEPSSR